MLLHRPTLVLGTALILISPLHGQIPTRPLVLNKTHYEVAAGGRIEIEAPSDSLSFMRRAEHRTARATPQNSPSFALAREEQGDAILLGVPFTTRPGDYVVTIHFADDGAEERAATLNLKVEPFALPKASASPPVVLLDGFQVSGVSLCPMSKNSSATFGNLQSYLTGAPNFLPPENVYFFENCTECPNCSIELLGAHLASFLNALPVTQVDVVAHSMGGLIVRSYLSGKQASGGFSPPFLPKIRKAIFIATPHFGPFRADGILASILFATGVQANAMKRGSAFLWDLATWNQLGEDLRGVDALAIIGNAGPSSQSDGVAGTSSTSLDFVARGRTRIIGYCHLPPASFAGLAGSYTDCTQPGIALVDGLSHPTYKMTASFLAGSSDWQSIGIAPTQDATLSRYGGVVVADVTAGNQYLTPSSVSFGSVSLLPGVSPALFFADFVSGAGSFNFGTSTCGPYSAVTGVYSAVRCKFSPTIYSVGPLLPVTGKVVQAGTTITISGTGFGAQQCSSCRVTAANPQSVNLQISSWSDSTIRALLPASFGFGAATIGVTTASGSDAINIMGGTAASPPVISLSQSSLTFNYTQNDATPTAQSVIVTNTGGGTLSLSATSNSAWLNATVIGATISVSVSPAGLAPNTYQGSIAVAGTGASNSPQTISVRLVVAGVAAPPIVISAIRHSATGLSGPIAPGELITIAGSGLGPTTPAVFSLNPITGAVDTALVGTRVLFNSIAAPITYTSPTQINVIAPYELASQSQVSIQVQFQNNLSTTQTIQVAAASPGAYTLNSSGSGPVVAANQDGTINTKDNPAAKGSYVTIYFTGGGQTNPAGVTGSVTGAVLKWLVQPASVVIGNRPATVTFAGAAPTFVDGVNQLNIQLAPDTPSGAQPIVMTIAGRSSPSSVTLAVQ